MPRSVNFVLLSLVFLSLISGESRLHASDIDDIEGVWRTEGYGYILEIRDGAPKLYEATSISCLESVLRLGPLSVSSTNDDDSLVGRFPAQVPGFIDAQMEIRKSDRQDSILLRRSDTVTQMTAHRFGGFAGSL